MSVLKELNEYQQRLVETHIDVIEWTIRESIYYNEGIVGLSYNDIYGEGCYWLCRAALDYNGTTKFKTYSKVVVKRGLISYCRNVFDKYKRQPLLHMGDVNYSENVYNRYCISFTENEMEYSISTVKILDILGSVKAEYSGVVRKGIEALEMQLKGYSGPEIAEMYGVKPNHVSAWKSRASQRLRKDNRFISGIAC